MSFVDAGILIEDAAKKLIDIESSVSAKNPFAIEYLADYRRGWRGVGPVLDPMAGKRLGKSIQEYIQDLRSALDYSYGAIIGPLVQHETEKKRRNIQFPFSDFALGFERAMKDRFAPERGEDFLDYLRSLQPYSDCADDKFIYEINRINVVGKHIKIVPVGVSMTIDSRKLGEFLPDMPRNWSGRATFGGSGGPYMKWFVGTTPEDIRYYEQRPHDKGLFRFEIGRAEDVHIGGTRHSEAEGLIQYLRKLSDTAASAVDGLKRFQ